jgi:uncharacterized protein (DUF58 family)
MRVRSLHPFGFLLKMLPGMIERAVWIWPARINYTRHPSLAPAALAHAGSSPRAGASTDLLSLRPYRPGDPMRSIHWKASARMRRLLVRQFAAEAALGFRMRLDAPQELWNDATQFERLCSLAATLAEDLFREGRLIAVAVAEEGWRPVRKLSDLEAVLDMIAVVRPTPPSSRTDSGAVPNMLTFEPGEGGRILARVDGQLAATA